jgi:hypothetical protein
MPFFFVFSFEVRGGGGVGGTHAGTFKCWSTLSSYLDSSSMQGFNTARLCSITPITLSRGLTDAAMVSAATSASTTASSADCGIVAAVAVEVALLVGPVVGNTSALAPA